MRKHELIVGKEDHQSRIDDFAYRHQITRKALKAIKMKGDILVDGVHRTVRYVLSQGEHITFIYPQEDNHLLPQDIPLHIIYEDEYLMVIDKQAGILCIPTRAHPKHTLANALTYYYQQHHIHSTIHFVNRLDKETRGLMIVAKYRDIHQLLSKNMTHIHRVYRCHVEGLIDKEGTIDAPIYKDGYQMKRIIDERGQKAITHYRCIKHEGHCSFVECYLETGRTHQIRVHMASIGHPLIGDPLYGHDGDFDLESVKVCFKHPITQQMICIEKKQ